MRRPTRLPRLPLAVLVLTSALGGGCRDAAAQTGPAARAVAPERLADTGLFADAASETLAPGVRPFTPRYPLWTDGATKRRWVWLPPGTTIDARDPEAWDFPVGAKLWKEFSFGRRVETRFMQRTADGWLYATYLWPEDGGEARLAPDQGIRGVCETGTGGRHDVPSVLDCRACHDGHPSGALGFGAVQLGPERDPDAPHAETPASDAIDLVELVASGTLRGDPQALLAAGAPIEARSSRERAVLGYLHGNCGGCHNGVGPLASLGLELEFRRGAEAPVLRTAVERPSRYVPAGQEEALRLVPGDPEHSVLALRMGSRFGATQMPPLGTHVVDEDALALVREWIRSDLATPEVAQVETRRTVATERQP